MITLVDGLGQLGEQLKEQTGLVDTAENIYIYHTWNPWDKGHEAQKREYEKFKLFVGNHLDDRIVFVSTYSENENYYVHFKQRAAAYLISTCEDALVVRLPNLVGNKGILKKLKERAVKPIGIIEFISLEAAAKAVIAVATSESIIKSHRIHGDTAPASLISEIFDKLKI